MDASTILSETIANLGTEAAQIIPAALVVGGALLAVRKGWGYVKSFTK